MRSRGANLVLVRRLVLPAAMALLFAGPAGAHTGETAAGGGFAAGFLHPLSGLDHMAAMVAVGLWGAVLGAPAVWLLPVTFPLVMAIGGVIGIVGAAVPYVETGVALSGLVLGLMVAAQVRPPLWLAAALVATFAIFHGVAHGAELPRDADALAYSAGFVVATGLLHLSGIALSLLRRVAWGQRAVQAGGALIAATGLYFLVA